jgi:preprotein translocase subunit SecG
MGVKQTTDVLEKGTWIFAGVIGALCLLSVLFISGGKSGAASSKATEAPVPATSQPAGNQPGTLTLPTTTPNTAPGTNPK